MSQVDLVIPGLLNLPVHELDRQVLTHQTPALTHLLSFARQLPNKNYDFDQVLIQRLGLHQQGLPYAQAIQAGEGESASLLFKALHLRPDINNAILYPLEEHIDKINIINDLKDYFKVDCDVISQTDDYNLMQLHQVDTSSIPATPHYLSVLGKPISEYIQQVKSNLLWYRLLNEMQMFMHQHEINQQRWQQDQPMVNSLWCWGGAQHSGETFPDIRWYSDDGLMQSLGRLYCGQAQPLSALADDGIRQDTLIIDLSLLRLLKGDADGDIQQLLIDLDQRCLQPLLKSSARHIRLHTTGNSNFHYRPSQRWKFWTRQRSAIDVCDPVNQA